MSQRFTVFPAQPLTSLVYRTGDTFAVIAWRFDELQGTALPITVGGIVSESRQYDIFINGEKQ